MECFKVVTSERKSICDLLTVRSEFKDPFVLTYKKGEILYSPTKFGIWCFIDKEYATDFVLRNANIFYPHGSQIILKVKGYHRKRKNIIPLVFDDLSRKIYYQYGFECLTKKNIEIKLNGNIRQLDEIPEGTVRFNSVKVLT